MPDSFLKTVAPSPDHRYSRRSHGVIDQILNQLAFRDRDALNLVVGCGLSGSPLDRIHRILADMFDMGIYLGYSAQLGEYHIVHSIAMDNLCQLDVDSARGNLQRAINKLSDGRRILILELFNSLAETEREDVKTGLLQVLAQNRGKPIIGLFQMANENRPKPRNVFRNLRMQVIDIPKYDAVRTAATIDEYYSKEWLKGGITLSPSALTALYNVEPAVFLNGSRKTLPYLAIDLVKETISTLRTIHNGTSANFAFTVLNTAYQKLENLLADTGQVNRALARIEPYLQSPNSITQHIAIDWVRRCRALEYAKDDLASAISDFPQIASPTPPNPFEITMAVINAQFFSTSYELALEDAFDLAISLS